MASFTCITCRVAFADADRQRAHYKGDWHRYNLKRKVVDLPPITAENFLQKAQALQAQASQSEASGGDHCDVCNKHFTSRSTFENHLKSKRHREVETRKSSRVDSQKVFKDKKEKTAKEPTVAMEEDGKVNCPRAVEEDEGASDADSTESWEGEPLGVGECLFCPVVSDDVESSVRHMTAAHGFFLPDVEYLVDLDGLVAYLGEKVGAYYLCLWCCDTGKAFYSTVSVQRHMTDKGHCKMRHEGDTLLEYANFYDYRSSYPNYVPGEVGSGEKVEEEEEGEGAEEDVEGNDYQLVLPSGSTVGHRSLVRYYRQNLRSASRTQPRAGAASSVLAHYRGMLSWTGATGVVAAQKKARDIAFAERQRSQHHMRLGMKANKLHMKYFRNQIFAYGAG